MLSLYLKNYKDFSAKYGAKTCICLMVGSFYELYDCVDAEGDTQVLRDLAKQLLQAWHTQKAATNWVMRQYLGSGGTAL
jgi:hypothetical protein